MRWLVLVLVACGGPEVSLVAPPTPEPEVCDGLDNDLDGETDEDATSAWYLDVDGDGAGDARSPIYACEKPEGTTDEGGDCDDLLASVNPGAPELCNGIDDDCDGVPDDGASGQATWYADLDGDGAGNPSNATLACDAPASYVADDTDCDDEDSSAFPGADEQIADGVDQDCDGLDLCYVDADSDGFGSDQFATASDCGTDDLVADVSSDCNDLVASVWPGAPETPADGVDQDCDGFDHCFVDADGDAFGAGSATASTALSCDHQPAFAANDLDCDDAEPTVHPAAPERCDGIANACGTALGAEEQDVDGDGYVACSPTAWKGASVLGGDDCDDANPYRFPGASEVCDGIPNTCSTLVLPADEVDDDGDGFVDCAIVARGWDGPAVQGGDDCDDTRSATYPGASEVCDGVPNDCGTALTGSESDRDGDGWVECSLSSEGWLGSSISGDADCDDDDASVHPDAVELCDGIVNACTNALPADEIDEDEDGFVPCALDPNGWDGTPVLGGMDCADDDATRYPGAPELCDGIANDCDATTAPDEEVDGDGDGFVVCPPDNGGWDGASISGGSDCDDSDPTVAPGAVELCDGLVDDCDALDLPESEVDGDHDGYVDCAPDANGWDGASILGGSDCVDVDATVYPGAFERCDGQQNDCDGQQMASQEIDVDADGYVACDIDSGGWDGDPVDGGSDCDDADPTRFPTAPELCDGIIDDCDATKLPDLEIDQDFDGYVDCALASDGWDGLPILGGSDCDDASRDRYPGAEDSPGDAVDQDCNGVDRCFVDADRDGYGTTATADADDLDCGDGTSAVSGRSTDCDDQDDRRSPGHAEVCKDGLDNDCIDDPAQCEWRGTFDLADTDIVVQGTGLDPWMATMGDLTGDGKADLYVVSRGVWTWSNYAWRWTNGAGHLISGIAPGDYDLALDADTVVTSTTSPYLGVAIADITGDGRADLVASKSRDLGQIVGFRGPVASATLDDARAAFVLDGPDYASLGQSLAVGELDATPGNDVVVTAPDNGCTLDWYTWQYLCKGAVYVVRGPVTRSGTVKLSDVTTTEIRGIGGERLGIEASVRDLDGDLVPDLLLTGAHAAYGFFAPIRTGVLTIAEADVVFDLGTPTSWTVGGAGDATGDGRADLIVGGDGVVGGDPGGYLFSDAAKSAVTNDASAIIRIAPSYSYTGADIIGDVNGDGVDDLFAGGLALSSYRSYLNGFAAIVYGPITGDIELPADADALWEDGSVGAGTGDTYRALGDVDGDGYDDFAVTARWWKDGTGTERGLVGIVYGRGI